MKGNGTSPSTLIQLATASLPPIDSSFYQTIDQTIDNNVPMPANEINHANINQLGGKYQNLYYKKYMKYKQKYIALKK